MNYTIYLVEDDKKLNKVLMSYLLKEGWNVRSFADGQQALNEIKNHPHLWIVDIVLPKVDGYQLVNEIKKDCPQVPVIFISCLDTDLDRIFGLEFGSDDYLGKPFLPRELILKTKIILERTYSCHGPASNSAQVLTYPPLKILLEKRSVLNNDKPVKLTGKEFDLLILFVRSSGNILNREQIIQVVWGSNYYIVDRVVDDLVHRLRKKIPELKLETCYGYGYSLLNSSQ